MLSIVRTGPKFLMLESQYSKEIIEYFMEKFKCDRKNDFLSAFQEAGEENTIIFIVKKAQEVVKCSECIDILVINEYPDVILCSALNSNIKEFINFARIAPRVIVMRVFGDIEKVIEKVKEDYKFTEGTFIDLLDSANEKGTILAFAEKPINKLMSITDFYEKAVYIEEKYSKIYKDVRVHALRYLNEGLNNKDWYEMEIKIYDRYSAYDLHYERLVRVLESLEIGIILGESWAKDYPRMFMSVGVYRVRFFTFYEPKYIKKILVGLEYLEDGTRIVDYDLFNNRKKIDWTHVIEDNLRSKNLLGEKYRKEIFSKLEEKEIKDILKLEYEIIQTRD